MKINCLSCWVVRHWSRKAVESRKPPPGRDPRFSWKSIAGRTFKNPGGIWLIERSFNYCCGWQLWSPGGNPLRHSASAFARHLGSGASKPHSAFRTCWRYILLDVPWTQSAGLSCKLCQTLVVPSDGLLFARLVLVVSWKHIPSRWGDEIRTWTCVVVKLSFLAPLVYAWLWWCSPPRSKLWKCTVFQHIVRLSNTVLAVWPSSTKQTPFLASGVPICISAQPRGTFARFWDHAPAIGQYG